MKCDIHERRIVQREDIWFRLDPDCFFRTYISSAYSPYARYVNQFLNLTPIAPAEAGLEFALYGFTYRVTGTVAGERVFGFDLSPTYAAEFDRVVKAAVKGEDASMTATSRRSGVSSAGGVLTIHAEQPGDPPVRVSWTLGPEAAAALGAWIGR